MDSQTQSHDKLWKYSDLALYLGVSEHKLRRDVMNREIPFIKIGRSIRFDKKQITDFLNIEFREDQKPPVIPIIKNNKLISINDTVKWLVEKSALYPYAEINIRVIIHDSNIKRIERTVTEKFQDII